MRECSRRSRPRGDGARVRLGGFGESPPPLESVPYIHADDLAALLDDRGIDDVVAVGLSMGGWVATEFTLTYPARVRGLVLDESSSRSSVRCPPSPRACPR